MITLPIPTENVTYVRGPKQGQWTYDDWKQLPDDGKRYEIIEGALYVTTAPSSFHQYIIKQLYRHFGLLAEDAHHAVVYLAPIGLFMPNCDPVQPDFMLILQEHVGIIRNRRIEGVPDLIVEVISPGSRAYDEGVKLEAYANAGVPEYAIIDPATRKLRHYTLETPGQFAAPREYGEGDALRFACLPDILLNVTDLFANAPDTTV